MRINQPKLCAVSLAMVLYLHNLVAKISQLVSKYFHRQTIQCLLQRNYVAEQRIDHCHVYNVCLVSAAKFFLQSISDFLDARNT